jgi:hypothetical protein
MTTLNNLVKFKWYFSMKDEQSQTPSQVENVIDLGRIFRSGKWLSYSCKIISKKLSVKKKRNIKLTEKEEITTKDIADRE